MGTAPDNLYVTYVDVDRDLLKIWGQRNRIGATYIERQLLQLLPEFNRTPSPNAIQIRKGMFCFAKYTDDNYYRARVISGVQNDSVGVLFVDYGNRDLIKLSNIRIPEGSDKDVLAKMSEQAEEYYLAGIAAPSLGWTKEIVSEIRRDICYEEFFYQIVAQVGDQKIVEIQFRNHNYSNYLVKKQLASSLSLLVQRQMVLSYCSLVSSEMQAEVPFRETPRMKFTPSVPPPNLRSVRPSNVSKEGMMQSNFGKANHPVNYPIPAPVVRYSTPQHMSTPIQHVIPNIPENAYYPPVSHLTGQVPVNSNSPLPVNPVLNPLLNNPYNPLPLLKESINSINNNESIIQILAQQVKQYIAQDNAKTEFKEENIPHHYVNSVLEVGSTYNVLISYIDDGPWSFSVQLLSSESELQNLMDDLLSTELIPLKPPIILGHPCIASSALYGNLCRGVIVSISRNAVKVYFVDFGNTEDLPSSSIYELPPKFFKIRALSQKFSLSGLQKIAYSDDIKKFFKEAVQEQLVMLRVTSLEGNNLPTCELFLREKNIKRILNEKIREMRSSTEDFPKVGDTESVVVTCVVSPQKFFVQLHKRDAELNALKKELSEVEAIGQRLTYQQLSVGFKCACKYRKDGQWYRAVITSVDSENEIAVFYVDYGNTETVSISLLRSIQSPGLIHQMSNQAIQCSLKEFEDKPFDKELADKFGAVILKKDLQMTIVSSEKELLSVQLFENGENILQSLETISRLEENSETFSQKDGVFSSSVSPVSPAKDDKENKFPANVEEVYDKTKGISRNEVTSFEFKENLRNDKNKNNDRKEQGSNNRSAWKPLNQTSNNDNWDTTDWKFGGGNGNRDDWDTTDPKFLGNKNRYDRNNENARFGKNGSRSDRNKENPNFGKSRANKQDRNHDDKKENFGDRKKFDDNRRGRERSNDQKFGGEVNKNRCRDSSVKRDDSRKKFDSSQFSGSNKPKSMRRPIRRDDVAPSGSKFEDKVIPIGSCEKGIVTYYFSPDEFFVQLLSQEEEFRKMMKDIQAYYCDKYSTREPLQVGDVVIAQFSVDKVLYRAEVIRATPVTVRYVDYGNQEPVGPKQTWLIDKQFLKLPKQVIRCKLSNIQPSGLYWPPPGSEIDKFFELSAYECTFLNMENDMYEISMKNVDSGKDVASEIIATGLGRPLAPKLDVPEIDYFLLPKQVLRLYVSHIESWKKFFVVLNSEGLEIIENELKAFTENKKNLIPLSEKLRKPETLCLSTSDDLSWGRASIIKTDSSKLLLRFIDRGDSVEVTSDKVMSLPDYLKVFQSQAVECSLHGVTNVDEEKFKQTVLYKHLLVSIVAASGMRLSVVLYDEDGQKFDFQVSNNSPQTIEPISHLPLTSQKIPVMISHIESAKEIHIHRVADEEDLINISELLENFYAEENDDFNIDKESDIGMLVAAKSVFYDTWYRGRLLSSTDENFEIFYIDYGNKEILPRERVKKLCVSFFTLHAFSKQLSLDIEFSADRTVDINNKILEVAQDKIVLAYLYNNNGEFLFDFFLDGERITHLLKSLGLAILKPADHFTNILSGKKTQPIFEPSSVDKNSYVKTLPGDENWDIKSPSVDKNSSVKTLPGDEDWNVKSPSVDENWDIKSPSVDKNSYVKTMPGDEDWNVKSPSVDENWDVKSPSVDKNSCVKTLPNDEDWNVKLPSVHENWDVKPPSVGKNSYVKTLPDDENLDVEADGLLVCLSHIDNPKQFWVHKESQANELQQFQNKLQESCKTLPEKKHIKVGDIVASLFSDMWYRAVVTEIKKNNVTVQFIDYGNTFVFDSNCNTLKELPNEFVSVPIFATCYSLGGTWKENATSKFEEIILQNDEPVSVVVLEESDRPVVDLIQKGKSITEILTEAGVRCEEKEEGVEEDNKEEEIEIEEKEKAEKEKGLYNVYITYCYTPSDFYIHKENCTDIVNKLNDSLADVSDFESPSSIKKNEIYAAKFSDDGAWYRARVIKQNGNEIEVHFIDYGNTSVVSELKCLPNDLASIPHLAENCCLLYPDHCDSWSEAACEKFIEYSDGQQLKMEVVAKNVNKLFVKLFYDNKYITDELGALCEKDGREDVYVSHALSPTDFYIQYVDDDNYRLIADKLESGDECENLEDKKPGVMCQACFVDDGYWYRAKILRNLDEGCEVFFIDFGNISVSKELKRLPPEVEDIPPRALRCALNLPETNIPESLKEDFMSLVAEAPIFQVRIIVPGDLNIVSLKLNGRILEETFSLEVENFSNLKDCETDDSKNSKNNMNENYLNSNSADPLNEKEALWNQTDEEKTVNIGISELEGSEGIKSDDKKNTEENVSSGVNAADNELIEEVEENERGAVSESKIKEWEGDDENKDWKGDAFEEANSFEDTVGSETPEKLVVMRNDIGGHHVLNGVEKKCSKNNNYQTQNRNKVHKIVPGSICRGEKEVNEIVKEEYTKVKFSDKLVPGSISRGVSLESVPKKYGLAEKSCNKQISQSAPNTPNFERRSHKKAYMKVDQSNRLVPGCISMGIPLQCSPFTEKISRADKIVPGSVNGSLMNH